MRLLHSITALPLIAAVIAALLVMGRRRRSRRTPCANCGRTLLNAKIRNIGQILLGGWTCSKCGHEHATRRGRIPESPSIFVAAE